MKFRRIPHSEIMIINPVYKPITVTLAEKKTWFRKIRNFHFFCFFDFARTITFEERYEIVIFSTISTFNYYQVQIYYAENNQKYILKIFKIDLQLDCKK